MRSNISQLAKRAMYLVQAMAISGLGFAYISCIQDPFDPNFALRYEPQFHMLPPLPATTDMPVALAARLTGGIRHGSRAVAYLQAVNISLNRYTSALQVHDVASAALQEGAILDFVKLASDELEMFARELRRATSLSHGSFLRQPISIADVKTVLERYRTQGEPTLPAIERGAFRVFGLDPSYLLTGAPSGERSIRHEESTRGLTSLADELEDVGEVIERLSHRLREGLERR